MTEYLDILKPLAKKDVFAIAPGISAERLANAKSNYFIDPDDECLALLDNSVGGSAKTGLAIGRKGVYFKSGSILATTPHFISWNELLGRGVQGKFMELKFDDNRAFDTSGTWVNSKSLAVALNSIAAMMAKPVSMEEPLKRDAAIIPSVEVEQVQADLTAKSETPEPTVQPSQPIQPKSPIVAASPDIRDVQTRKIPQVQFSSTAIRDILISAVFSLMIAIFGEGININGNIYYPGVIARVFMFIFGTPGGVLGLMLGRWVRQLLKPDVIFTAGNALDHAINVGKTKFFWAFIPPAVGLIVGTSCGMAIVVWIAA